KLTISTAASTVNDISTDLVDQRLVNNPNTTEPIAPPSVSETVTNIDRFSLSPLALMSRGVNELTKYNANKITKNAFQTTVVIRRLSALNSCATLAFALSPPGGSTASRSKCSEYPNRWPIVSIRCCAPLGRRWYKNEADSGSRNNTKIKAIVAAIPPATNTERQP